MRVRHYTRVSGMEAILREQVIRARDQNKVFVENANRKPLSPNDAKQKWILDPGKGGAYVEFDAEEAEVTDQPNPLSKQRELYLRGDVWLAGRNVAGRRNR